MRWQVPPSEQAEFRKTTETCQSRMFHDVSGTRVNRTKTKQLLHVYSSCALCNIASGLYMRYVVGQLFNSRDRFFHCSTEAQPRLSRAAFVRAVDAGKGGNARPGLVWVL